MPLPLNNLHGVRRSRPMLGTFVEIRATGPGAAAAQAVDAAFAAVENVERTMSFHDGNSDVSRINASGPGREIPVDPLTYRVLEFAQRLSEISGGAFDITIAPVLVRNGFLPPPRFASGSAGSAAGRVPSPVTYRDLELLDGNRIRWRRKGWIDLGGIAKGFAVDQAIEALRSHRAANVAGGVVNAGGDLRCFGEAQPIHLRDPDAPGTTVPLGTIRDCAIATSGGYFAGIARGTGRRIDPLVNPKRRACTAWDKSVSVIARECMTADALTKVVRLSPESAPEVLARFGAQAIVMEKHALRSCGADLLREAARA